LPALLSLPWGSAAPRLSSVAVSIPFALAAKVLLVAFLSLPLRHAFLDLLFHHLKPVFLIGHIPRKIHLAFFQR
jgi:hypothetical protein